MSAYRTALALAACLSLTPAARGEEPPPGGAPPPGSLAHAVERLDHPDPAERRRAHADLRRRGPEVLTTLPPTGTARSAEQRRALSILRSEVIEDWGRARTPEGMVYVPAGPVRLPHEDESRDPGPGGTAWVPAFYLDRTEVTVGAWRAWRSVQTLVGETESMEPDEDPPPSMADELPVTRVSRESARRFAREMRSGHLPTLEEYLRAVRGSGPSTWPWGARFLNHRAHLEGDGRDRAPLPVGSLPLGAGPQGALDLIGNVAEWSDSAVTTRGRSSGEPLVWGGSWTAPAEPSVAWGRAARGSSRRRARDRSPEIGFRVARAVDPLPVQDPEDPRRGEPVPDGR
jgi:formylglycine-generating enzyme required for sulfatase activity